MGVTLDPLKKSIQDQFLKFPGNYCLVVIRSQHPILRCLHGHEMEFHSWIFTVLSVDKSVRNRTG